MKWRVLNILTLGEKLGTLAPYITAASCWNSSMHSTQPMPKCWLLLYEPPLFSVFLFSTILFVTVYNTSYNCISILLALTPCLKWDYVCANLQTCEHTYTQSHTHTHRLMESGSENQPNKNLHWGKLILLERFSKAFLTVWFRAEKGMIRFSFFLAYTFEG